MGCSGKLDMVQLENLLGDSLCQFGATVSVEVHPPGGDHVEVFAASGIPKNSSRSTGNRNQFPPQAVLGEGMPDRSGITG
jgi:hypothetical protein